MGEVVYTTSFLNLIFLKIYDIIIIESKKGNKIMYETRLDSKNFSDFEKLCDLLHTPADPKLLEKLVIGDIGLVINWNENGSIKDWGILYY